MDFMEENCVNSGFYRTQEGPRKGIEIDGRRFIHDPTLYIGHYSEIESILEIEEPEHMRGKIKIPIQILFCLLLILFSRSKELT